ncbi:MAG: DUF6056 family protein [Kofleriaceae bacterium]
MSSRTFGWLRILFAIYVLATIAHIGYVVAHEPFSFDAWNMAVDTNARPFSLSNFFDYWFGQYLGSNPRLGQPLAYLTYKLHGVAEVGTPLAYLAIVVAAFALGTGELPRWRRGRDLATLAIGLGSLWFAAPSIGMTMFCRAYSTNYFWACALQLWFLVALLQGTRASSPRHLVALGLLGVVAGMCNEHTGPTLVLIAVATVALARRRGKPLLPSLVGLGGVLGGFALIFFAPGQAQRYGGLAQQAGLSERLLQRGVAHNLDIFVSYLHAVAPLLLLVVAVIVATTLARRDDVPAERDPELTARSMAAFTALGVALLCSVAITVTIFVSPKLGPRFYLHGCAGLLAGFLGIVRALVVRPRGYLPLVILAVAASVYAAAMTIPRYTTLKQLSTERLASLSSQPAGGVITVESWPQVASSWWSLGDDFRDHKKRDLVATYFGLGRIVLRGSDAAATLGMTDVRLRFRYQLDPVTCIEQLDGVTLPELVSRDISDLLHKFTDVVEQVRRHTTARLRQLDLEIEFEGPPVQAPAPHLYVARWRDGVMTGFSAQVLRRGISQTRVIAIPPELAASDWTIYAYLVGHESRRIGSSLGATTLSYVPWGAGQYWVLACHPDQCFVLSARR